MRKPSDPTISMTMLWDSYHKVWIVTGTWSPPSGRSVTRFVRVHSTGAPGPEDLRPLLEAMAQEISSWLL